MAKIPKILENLSKNSFEILFFEDIAYSKDSVINFSSFLKKLIDNKGIVLRDNMSDAKYLIDWKATYKNHFLIPYQVFSDEQIKKILLNSKLSEYEYVILEEKFCLSVSKIKTHLFIENWEYFCEIDYDNQIVMSEDGKLIMEFTDEGSRILRSNFLLNTDKL